MAQRDERNFIARGTESLAIAVRRTFRPKRPGIKNRLLPLRPSFYALIASLILGLLCVILLFDANIMEWKREGLLGKTDRFAWSWHIRWFSRKYTEAGNSIWILFITAICGIALSCSKWRELKRKNIVRRASLYADLNFVFFTVVLSGALSSLLKGVFGRARPKLMNELGATHFEPFNFDYEFASFPSGHATTFGALCMAAALLFPRYRWVAIILALLGAASRVVIDAHYPADVVAGLIFGSGLVVLSARWLAQRNVMFKFQGHILPKRTRPC